MATTSGSASDYLDLLDKFDDFVTTLGSNPWTQLKATYALPSTEGEVYYQLEGTDGTQEIYLNIKAYSSIPSDYFNWRLQGAIGFDTDLPFDDQPGSITSPPRLLLADDTINYNFIANGQRAIIIARIGTVVECAYMGFITPYMPFDYYPYPLFIGGSARSDLRYSDTSSSHQSFWTGMSNLRILTSWYSHSTRVAGMANENFSLYPPGYMSASASLLSTIDDGTWLLVPMLAMMYQGGIGGGEAPIGELDGVYWVSGYGLTHGDIISISGTDYMAIQNAFRSGINDFAAIKLL